MAKKLRSGLSYKHFAHPYDIAGIHNLLEYINRNELAKSNLIKIQHDAEDEFYLLNVADNLKLSRTQGASLYHKVESITEILSIETPNVFLDNNPVLNAYVLGGTNPSIVLNSALIEQMSDDMLYAVIGHELGHIISEHTFFRLLAQYYHFFSDLLSALPFIGWFLSLGTRWYLFDWYRKSEFTADRAALLATQDLEAVKNTIMFLSGGSTRIMNELNTSGFIDQADEFKKIMISKRELALHERTNFLFTGFMLQQAASTHPWPSVRLNELLIWASSEQYNCIIEGNYERAEEITNSAVVDGEVLSPPPPGDDIKEYIKDVSKSASEGFKNIFKKLKDNQK